MSHQKIKGIATELLWAVIILIIIVGVAFGASWFFIPNPAPPTGNVVSYKSPLTAPIGSQSEAEVARRVCDKVEKIIVGAANPLTLDDCIQADRACVKLIGPHAVWAGAASSNDVPYCNCDEGYELSPVSPSNASEVCVIQK